MGLPSLLTALLPLLAMNPASLATSSPSELQEQASQAGQIAHMLVSPSLHKPGSNTYWTHRGQGRDGEGLMWPCVARALCLQETMGAFCRGQESTLTQLGVERERAQRAEAQLAASHANHAATQHKVHTHT
jgi:hypothetical protein